MQALQQLFLVAGTAALEERMSSSSCSVTFPLIAVQRSVSNYETSTTKGELPRLCSPCLPHTHSLAFMSIKFLWYRHLCVLFISASAIPPPPISPPCDFPTSWFALSYSLCIIHFTPSVSYMLLFTGISLSSSRLKANWDLALFTFESAVLLQFPYYRPHHFLSPRSHTLQLKH